MSKKKQPVKELPKCFGDPEAECVTSCALEPSCANNYLFTHEYAQEQKFKSAKNLATIIKERIEKDRYIAITSVIDGEFKCAEKRMLDGLRGVKQSYHDFIMCSKTHKTLTKKEEIDFLDCLADVATDITNNSNMIIHSIDRMILLLDIGR